MEEQILAALAQFNLFYRELDEIYHQYAARQGIGDAALWLLYSLRESPEPMTQRQLCAEWHSPPQTVNSALKRLEQQGCIALEPVPGNRKSKLVVLTETGRELTRRVIEPVMLAERRALSALTEEERAALTAVTRKYLDALHRELG